MTWADNPQFISDKKRGEQIEERVAKHLNADVVDKNVTRDYDIVFKDIRMEIKAHKGISPKGPYDTLSGEYSNKHGHLSHYLKCAIDGVYQVIGHFNEYNSTLYLFKAKMYADYVLKNKWRGNLNIPGTAYTIRIPWEEKEAGFFKKIHIK